ncbi:MAG: 23S rRNA (guanosine(2251)-2'-O)-methyltransferase RlmB [Armatimonadota bacterium]|nr:23S rRNA (guanosine(2251)-2'-O)-methyltransferase RlmB [Armatimonadota bacterium]
MAGGRPQRPEILNASDVQIEGRHPVLEALRAGRPLRKLVVTRGAASSHVLHHLVGEARRRGVPVQEVDPAVLDRLAQTRTPQGVIAYAAAYTTVDLDDVLARGRTRGESPLLLLLDGIEDPGNLGAILRSADAAGVHGVVIPRHRTARLTPAVAASSAGAIEHVPVAQVTNLARAIERLKAEGVWVIGADPGAREALYEARLLPPVAVVVGGEGRGLSRLVRERCDALVRIPMYGATASLNASVAAGVLLFEVRRQMGAARLDASAPRQYNERDLTR